MKASQLALFIFLLAFDAIAAEAHGWASTSVQMDDAVPNSKSTLAQTPNLEKLSTGGMKFANSYSASPRCTPTRAALFTGAVRRRCR